MRRSSWPAVTARPARPLLSMVSWTACAARRCRPPELMPIGQPFTLLCQQLARPRFAGRADLHTHTTHSDGNYHPVQVVELARRAGLSAVAITDHDTTSGIA